MWIVYAVNISTVDKDEYDNDDYICFEESEREAAEKYADEIGVDVDEWLLLYRSEWFECNWRSEELFNRLEKALTEGI